MSTDPQWDAAARKRRGQNQRAGFGQALQGVGGQLLGYMMQNQMADKRYEQEQALQQQAQQDQFTLGDLAMMINGGGMGGQVAGPPSPGMPGVAPVAGQGAPGPLSSLFPGGFDAGSRAGVPVPHGLWNALRDPAKYDSAMNVLTTRLQGTSDAIRQRADLGQRNQMGVQDRIDNRTQLGWDFSMDMEEYKAGQRAELANTKIDATAARDTDRAEANRLKMFYDHGKLTIGPDGKERAPANPIAQVVIANNLTDLAESNLDETTGLLGMLMYASDDRTFRLPDGTTFKGSAINRQPDGKLTVDLPTKQSWKGIDFLAKDGETVHLTPERIRALLAQLSAQMQQQQVEDPVPGSQYDDGMDDAVNRYGPR